MQSVFSVAFWLTDINLTLGTYCYTKKVKNIKTISLNHMFYPVLCHKLKIHFESDYLALLIYSKPIFSNISLVWSIDCKKAIFISIIFYCFW